MFPQSLCATCRHRLVSRNKRGSEFWRCDRARYDARFLKYPPQPVSICAGHEAV